jgi:hypothetical protein
MVAYAVAGRGRSRRQGNRDTPPEAAPPAPDGLPRWMFALLFGSALAVRLLFWHATPDRSWGYSALYKGDAALWLDYAHALRAGRPFELGLPIHPPGTAYLVSWLWDGTAAGIRALRVTWLVLGALVPPLLALVAGRAFGPVPGALAGAAAVSSTALIVLSSSVNSEVPYLLLVIGSFALHDGLLDDPRTSRAAAWSALQALACLIRVEHVLFTAAMLAWLAWRWGRAGVVRLLVAAATFCALLLPWHVQAWRSVARFNTAELATTPGEEGFLRSVEAAVKGLPWEPDAQAERERLPAFARRTASGFVAATVAHRGGRAIRGQDLAILDEAFGYRPRPVASFPFVSSYGPLNFALANHAGATGGFSRSLLEAAPPLAGPLERYPPPLVRGLPPPDLALVYPPHLRLFNEGYGVGAAWIAAHPREFAALVRRKLGTFWLGASTGVTGYNLPLGWTGTRRAVDMALPDGALPVAWSLGWLLACLAGAWVGRGQPATWPWVILLATKVVVTAAFFGYARQGAAVVPAVLVLAALGAERALGRRAGLTLPWRRGIVGACVLAAALETGRWLQQPEVVIDGRPAGTADPVPADLHRDHQIGVR